MNLQQKSKLVEELFQELEKETKEFYEKGGLSCISGCGFCCANPKIPATPLEFLPLAFELYEKGLAEEFANRLALEEKPGNCILYRAQSEDEKKGFCGSYKHRGLICRLFGASSRKNSKTGLKELITCKLLKENFPQEFIGTTKGINAGHPIPVSLAWYTQLQDIDEALTNQYPINQAILMALEMVLRFKFYQEAEAVEQL